MKRFSWIAILVIAAIVLCGCDEPPDPTAAPAVVPAEHGNIYTYAGPPNGDMSGDGTQAGPFTSLMNAAAFVKNPNYDGPKCVDVYVIDRDEGGYFFYDTWDSTAPILIYPLDEGGMCEWVAICIVGTDSNIDDAANAFYASRCREGYLYTLTEEGGWEYKETWRTAAPLHYSVRGEGELCSIGFSGKSSVAF